MLIQTAKGLLDTAALDIRDVAVMGDNGVPFRKIATEYRLDGEIVRRDVTVTALRGIETEAQEGKLNG